MPFNEFMQGDCMEAMSIMPDDYVDLAIVDPPYGILNKTKRGSIGNHRSYKVRAETWDYKPSIEYFDELKRISKNQIICGYNYFADILGNCKGFIYWHKGQPMKNYADGELIYTSFDKAAKMFNYQWYGNITHGENRFHPTQKPIQLYECIKPCFLMLSSGD